MRYSKTITLKDGRTCRLRNAGERDGKSMLELFIRTHDQTDYLLTYPEECTFTVEQESQMMKEKTESADEVEILAEIEGEVVGSAGFEPVGTRVKVKHRADFGISVDREYWGLGIGRALTEATIECARDAGYVQMELQVVEENESAVALYKSEGFVEYGRNPRGFRSRLTGWQPLLLMRLELNN